MKAVLAVVAVLVVIAGVAATIAFRRDMGAAHERLAGRSQAIDTSFGRLEYAEAGAGDPVIGIHGSGGGFDQGLDMLGPLADGYRLIAPSRFGYLGSDFPLDATIAKQADALDELMGKLGIDRAFVVGGSAGAQSALQLAIRHPERCRALILVVPAAYAPRPPSDTSATPGPLMVAAMKAVLGSDFLFWSVMKLYPDGLTRLLLATDPALVHAATPEEQARVTLIREHIFPVSARAEGLIFDTRTAGAPEPMALDRITCPVLTVSLKDDLYGTAAPAEYIAREVADGRSVIYESGGHIWVGHQDDLWRDIKAFMATSTPTPVAAATQ